ncbi:GTPase [Syntrophotalea acetylenivorans]|uniref:GTPase n=1 Tax=Syntrophotalea acetylenivorans TaxID=1842532 RepID=A0A1L3GM06_9BACT|nr:GTPase [Syntrophotalea acetylenivorans]APG26964.1 GTPase [Syntrophotalea acetylenivorans]
MFPVDVHQRRKVVILGAGGRDFHNFNVLYRHRPEIEVVAFTAAQIPFQQNRCYPPELSGPNYPRGIPIVDEKELPSLLATKDVEVVFSYSDISHQQLMTIASDVLALGSQFILPSIEQTMLSASVPVLSVCAVRTGCGKSPLVRFLCKLLIAEGQRPVVVRHPMAYGDLEGRAVQRISAEVDLQESLWTLEEREEFEPLLNLGVSVYCGVDYQAILDEAEKAGDLIIWDGGNNDTPFFRPDLEVVLLDPLRAGDEIEYYPGQVNLRRANVLVMNKVDEASQQQLDRVQDNIQELNPTADVIEGRLEVLLDNPQALQGKRVVVVEDGPTVTHGGMAYGAGMVAAQRYGASEVVDPRSVAHGSLRAVYESWPHLSRVLPAMGYTVQQLEDLRLTLEKVDCDLIVSATPVDLNRLLQLKKPIEQVRYEFIEQNKNEMHELILAWLHQQRSS